MASVADLVCRKGRGVVSIAAGATVLEATRVMNEHRIGSVVVHGPDGELEGILTERDLLTRVLGAERDPTRTLVRDVMTREVVCCGPESPVEEIRRLFRERRIRHVPVKGADGKVSGLVSIGDVNAMESEVLAATVVSLEEYITRG
jgi:CBS domain-containing protein